MLLEAPDSRRVTVLLRGVPARGVEVLEGRQEPYAL